MITFNLSRSSSLSLDSVNEILKEGLEKNEEIIFYSGDIIKIFLKDNSKNSDSFTPNQKIFIELIKKIFFLKKAEILNFEKFDEKEIFKFKKYKEEKNQICQLLYFILSYLFLKKISKNIKKTDVLLKKLIKIDRTFKYEILDFIIKNFDENEINKLIKEFILYEKIEN